MHLPTRVRGRAAPRGHVYTVTDHVQVVSVQSQSDSAYMRKQSLMALLSEPWSKLGMEHYVSKHVRIPHYTLT